MTVSESFRRKSNSIRLGSGLLIQHRFIGQMPHGIAIFPEFFSISQRNHHNQTETETEYHNSYRKLMDELLHIGLDCVIAELLTDRELAEHRFRYDTETLSRRLSLSIYILKQDKDYHDLPIALITRNIGLKCCLLTLQRQPKAAHALVCLCDSETSQEDIDSVSRLRIPVLLVGRSENHPGAPGCLSNFQAETSRRISVWLYDELLGKNPEGSQRLLKPKRTGTHG